MMKQRTGFIMVLLTTLIGLAATPIPGQQDATLTVNPQKLHPSPWATYCGQYQGICTYSNWYPQYYGPYDKYSWRYLCIEYVNRFYAQVYPHQNMSWVYAAYDYYDSYQQLQLDRYPNGGTEPPRPEDLLCSNGGQWGHVAIVREVGSNYLKLIEQNWYQDGRDSAMTLTLTNSGGHYTLAPFSSQYPIQGWLRKPGMTLDDVRPCEENSSECTRYGTLNRWQEFAFNPFTIDTVDSTIAVSRNHLWWVLTNGTTRDNYAIWRPALSRGGIYDVYAFIPAIRGDTRSARYEVHHANGTTIVPINQNNFYGIFVSLGTNYRFNAGTSGYVLLGDDTGEQAGSRMVAFDNILFVYRGPSAAEEQGLLPSRAALEIHPQPNPFVNFTTVRDHKGEDFALYDVEGRLVGRYRGDRIGTDAPPGIYFLRPEGEGKSVRVVKVR